jgi:hypothetical protein
VGSELAKVFEIFESSFRDDDEKRFQSILHPALQLAPAKRHDLFMGAFSDFGLSKPKLVRSHLFELTIDDVARPVAECSTGILRGVAGPKRQWALFHTILDASEQVRFMELYAEVPRAIEKRHGTQYGIGLVMFHTQVWSHERKAPGKLLEEARKWSELGSPLTGWFLAESATRLLNANPYFQPAELAEARSITQEMFERGVRYAEWEHQLSAVPRRWKFVELSPVYQASGIEPGVRFQASRDPEPLKLSNECRKNLSALVKVLPKLSDRFHGVECLPYGPGEELTRPPAAGSVFLKWSDLKQ